MNMPGYTAEASLYRTSVHYRGKHHGGRRGGGDIGVSPQACSGLKVLVCNPAIFACNLCLAFLPSVPLVSWDATPLAWAAFTPIAAIVWTSLTCPVTAAAAAAVVAGAGVVPAAADAAAVVRAEDAMTYA